MENLMGKIFMTLSLAYGKFMSFEKSREAERMLSLSLSLYRSVSLVGWLPLPFAKRYLKSNLFNLHA